ncbi:MAG: DUF1491 family protein [Qingshengfaniella sp.]
MSRLAAGLWVQAYLMRLQLANIPAYVTQRGDTTAGAVLVKTAALDGTAVARQRTYDLMTGARQWMVMAEGVEAEVDAAITRQCQRDPDLWVVEVEARDGRDLLDDPSLAE